MKTKRRAVRRKGDLPGARDTDNIFPTRYLPALNQQRRGHQSYSQNTATLVAKPRAWVNDPAGGPTCRAARLPHSDPKDARRPPKHA